MNRISITPRIDWPERVEAQGLFYHTIQGEIYWDERAYYSFSEAEIETLEAATHELHQLCLQAVDYVVKKNLYHLFHIPEWFTSVIEDSWKQREPDLYGRFDLVYFDPKFPPKLLEYNADTPTSLLESSIIQYHWIKDRFPNLDQFNLIHSKLVARWQAIAEKIDFQDKTLYFACAPHEREDIGNTDYLRATAEQAGIQSTLITLDQTAWLPESEELLLLPEHTPIKALFKLYPWEWLLDTTRAGSIVPKDTAIFEPAWKMILSNKAILPLLWELFPNHPNLLPAYPVPDPLPGRIVKKPLLSREGANISILNNANDTVESSTGPYGKEGYIYQAFYPLPQFETNYTVIGSWVIGGESAGIGIREDSTLITKNSSRFIPHVIS